MDQFYGIIGGCFGLGAVFSIAFVVFWYDSIAFHCSPARVSHLSCTPVGLQAGEVLKGPAAQLVYCERALGEIETTIVRFHEHSKLLRLSA